MAALHPPTKPTAWSFELLRSIEWKRFEELCAAYLRCLGFVAKTQTHGPDGGIDISLFESEGGPRIAIVQCKAWSSVDVDVKPIRELIGVMAIENVSKAYFIATGNFSKLARRTAEGTGLELVDGSSFIDRIQSLPDPVKADLLAVATEGDYLTPTCPSCGVKMLERTSSVGSFWGCPRYPRCQNKIHKKSKVRVSTSEARSDWRPRDIDERVERVHSPMPVLQDERPQQHARTARVRRPASTEATASHFMQFALALFIFFAIYQAGNGLMHLLQHWIFPTKLTTTAPTAKEQTRSSPLPPAPSRPISAETQPTPKHSAQSAETPAPSVRPSSSDVNQPAQIEVTDDNTQYGDKQKALEAYFKAKSVTDCYEVEDWAATVACANKRIRTLQEFEALWRSRDPAVMGVQTN